MNDRSQDGRVARVVFFRDVAAGELPICIQATLNTIGHGSTRRKGVNWEEKVQ